jgi:hypothetical protein
VSRSGEVDQFATNSIDISSGIGRNLSPCSMVSISTTGDSLSSPSSCESLPDQTPVRVLPAMPLSLAGTQSTANASIWRSGDNDLSASYGNHIISITSADISREVPLGTGLALLEDLFGNTPTTPIDSPPISPVVSPMQEESYRQDLAEDMEFALQLDGILDVTTPPPTPVEGPQFTEDGGHSEDFHNLMFDEAAVCILPDYLIAELEANNTPALRNRRGSGITFENRADHHDLECSDNPMSCCAACFIGTRMLRDFNNDYEMRSSRFPTNLLTPSSSGPLEILSSPSSLVVEYTDDAKFDDL